MLAQAYARLVNLVIGSHPSIFQMSQCSEQSLLESTSALPSKASVGLSERLASAFAVCVSAPMMVGFWCLPTMLSVVLGMAFSNDVVFLSHQLQFALLLTVLSCYLTHELHKRNFRWALWISCASCLILMDPFRHVLYDAQFNPATCGPPGQLMSRETFYKLALLCRSGQIVGNLMIFATMFRSNIIAILESWCSAGNSKFT